MPWEFALPLWQTRREAHVRPADATRAADDTKVAALASDAVTRHVRSPRGVLVVLLMNACIIVLHSDRTVVPVRPPPVAGAGRWWWVDRLYV